jgi:alkylation response protein AidB-like acyl-CoA dehydrogenase
MVDLLPDIEQQQIIDTVAALLDDLAPLGRLRGRRPDDGFDADLAPRLAELGVFGLGVPETAGGLGLGACEEAIVFRELGRRLVSPSMLAISLAAALAAERRDPRLGDLMAGRAPAAFAAPAGGSWLVVDPRPDALALVVSPGGAKLMQLPGLESAEGFDEALSVAIATGDASVVMAGEGPAWSRRLALLLSAMACGQAEAARDLAVDYAKIRQQFGKPIGSFQAVKHRCADMAVRAERAWSMTAFAATAEAEGDPDAAFLIAAARIVARDAAHLNGASAIQVHGGVGFTAECDAHRFMKRAHVLDLLAGDVRADRLAFLELAAPA